MTTNMNCAKCGKEESNKHMGPVAEIMKIRGLCFRCAFWSEKVDNRDLPEVARIGGGHYTVAPEGGPSHRRGFGGERFTIRFFDGREVTTTNLWHQGEIPDDFRAELPDNAEFVRTQP